jgi:uncharacterized cupredoxin-like copper-binding protein
MAAGAVSFGTVASASPGHDDSGTKQSTKKTKKTKKKTPSKQASDVAAASSALGTVEAPRDIVVSMTDDLRFDPGAIAVAEGETIRFLLDNPTAAPHDFLIGDAEEQAHHAEEMAMGEGHHDAGVEDAGALPGAVTLAPGESAEVLATFEEAGELLIGCHVPGHWEAGMRGAIAVMPAGLTLATVEAPRDIVVSMTDDLRFDPGTIAVAEGETIRFLLDNPTAAPHDFLIGDAEEQVHHAEEMAMGEAHDDAGVEDAGGLPGAVTLAPGESAEVLATFDQAGELLIGCHVPGHWEAGMRGAIAVMPAGLTA